MASPIVPQVGLPINLGLAPDDFMGPRAMPYSFALSANVPQTFDMYKEISSGQIDNVQSIWVDNQNNTAVLTIQMDWQRLVVPIGAQGVFPVLTKNPANVTLISNASASIQIAFLNTPTPFCAWK
jgi:hypothetical protein